MHNPIIILGYKGKLLSATEENILQVFFNMFSYSQSIKGDLMNRLTGNVKTCL